MHNVVWLAVGLIVGILGDELVVRFKSRHDRRYTTFRAAWNKQRFGMAVSVLQKLYDPTHRMLCLGEIIYPCVVWSVQGDDVEALLQRPLFAPSLDEPVATSSDY